MLTPEAFEAAVAEAAGEQKVLVSIFMDGGVDALSLLAPTGDPRYRDAAPDARAGAERRLGVRGGRAAALASRRRAA